MLTYKKQITRHRPLSSRHNHKRRKHQGDQGMIVRTPDGKEWVVIEDLPLGHGMEIGASIHSASAARYINGRAFWRRTKHIKGYSVISKYPGKIPTGDKEHEKEEPLAGGSGFPGRGIDYVVGIVG